MSKNNVYEDRQAKEERRREKRKAKLEKHVVVCPHCGKNVLDHMDKCPYCEGELTPKGYRPMNEKVMRRVKIISSAVLIAVAVGIAIWIIATR